MALSKNRTLGFRLKEARLAKGLSQKDLGIAAGIDPFVASPRINRYELSVHEPDIQTARRLANALGVPTAYLYCDDDELAGLIQEYSMLDLPERAKARRQITKLTKTDC